MSFAGNMVKRALKKVRTKFMDKVGSRLVSKVADTSSDAPSAFHEPKRDLYSKIKDEK